ncbi:MAG: hypothetical protein OXH70_00810 [Acidobacteria bacterium]|nr:hypothetical protein [Acidobacteriota bacterium]
MTRQLTWSIVADGGTDRLLVPIIEWAIHRVDPQVESLEPQFRKRRGSVKEVLGRQDSGDMLVFVHRDSEGLPLEGRLQEFEGVERPDVVPVVPVQVSEAWILFDAGAIAKAAGAPSAGIGVPRVAELESIANPKQRLDELLVAAAGNPSGRRGRTFKRSLVARRVSVAEYIADYSPLENVPAFAAFQEALAERFPYAP